MVRETADDEAQKFVLRHWMWDVLHAHNFKRDRGVKAGHARSNTTCGWFDVLGATETIGGLLDPVLPQKE